ncbi:MAG: hypothetical protein KF779_10335 [Hyphomonadaceae bacterium]|nr:hypothetical protein [Hyphomonadaceae bacterium]
MKPRISLSAALFALLASGCATSPAPMPTTSQPEAQSAIPWSRDQSLATMSERVDRDAYLDAYVLDIGQGLCVYVDCPDEARPLLIDCGSDKLGRSTSRQITDWIDQGAEAAGSIALAISHPHADHYDVLPGIERARVESATAGGRRSDYTNRRFLNWFGSTNQLQVFSAQSSQLDYAPLSCGSATVDVLSANASGHTSENGDSLVIAISWGSTTLILPGDAEIENETAAVATARRANRFENQTTAVISSHHGSDEEGSNDEAFFAFWEPRYLIFSAEPTYRHAHPRCSMIERTQHLVAQGRETQIRCGVREDVLRTISTPAQLISTYNQGHVRIRLSRSDITVACLITSPACPVALDPGDVPATRTPVS